MGIFSIANQHIRFAVKLATAIVLALFVGFHFQLETPRWAVLTAAIVAAGPAFAAGGEPYSGAIRYRGFLRIIGTFIGCIAGLVIIIAMIRAPLLMILGVLYLGRFLYLDILAGTNRKLVCVGAGRLYRADHCDHHSAGTIAYAAVCRRTL
ncbi:p-hydroxybenzoic acid efflux pump subunit B [Escherichia coli]|uniref:p-hydroxybenzoic acid efflux pump subunit B n=1 Tax=Escherichia coli TaxID=562 RepID=A0A376MJ98_ECOLX|nr:p-hydroxybenzoic acid efflux pump subunit B [Escherichia coli]